jgi:hypothetical protein
MKKLTLVFVFLNAALIASAQWSGGLKAGLNLANFIGDDADGSDPRIGYHVGGYLNKSISEHVIFQPELLISSVGSKTKESGTDPDFGDYSIEGNAQLTYLTLPVMFVFNLNENVNLQAGPQLGFLMAAKLKYDIESDFISMSGSEDVKEQFKPIDFGVNVGVGVNFGLINAALRYNLGLSEIGEESGNIKNSVIQLSLGYKIVKK